jgi:hypothetical protein
MVGSCLTSTMSPQPVAWTVSAPRRLERPVHAGGFDRVGHECVPARQEVPSFRSGEQSVLRVPLAYLAGVVDVQLRAKLASTQHPAAGFDYVLTADRLERSGPRVCTSQNPTTA